MSGSSVYLDYNATTPVDKRVLEEMLPYFSLKFGNATSRSHSYGWVADEAVEHARKQVAELINASSPSEIIFTSGATESINLALKGCFEFYKTKGKHIITVQTEHKAVLDTCHYLEQQGADVTYLPVDRSGIVDTDEIKKAIRPDTILIAVMYANNETGTIQPVRIISEIAHQHGIIFFSDAAQAAGKIDIDIAHEGIDILSISGHKMYGPKGIGALYVRRKNPRVSLIPLIHGGGHEKGLRSGTLNVPGIVGLGKAAELAKEEMWEDNMRISKLRTKLEQILTELDDVYINGSIRNRLSNTSNLSFTGVDSGKLIAAIPSIAIAAGSACTSANPEPSHVLRAMGIDDKLAYSSIRFSLGKYTTEEEISIVIEKIKRAVGVLRGGG